MFLRRAFGSVLLVAAVECGTAHGQPARDPFAQRPAFGGSVAEAAQETQPRPATPVPTTVEPSPGELQASLVLPEDATRRRQLTHAIRLIESGRHDDAAQALGRLAESIGDADAFIRIEGRRQSLRSLKAEVQRRIGLLSDDGRAAYELAFGRPARRMLDEADRDRASLLRVATLYLHTQAGAEALYRLAALYRDRGEFPEAVACLERLRKLRPLEADRFEPHLSMQLALNRMQSGDPEGAAATVRQLRKRSGSALVIVAGKEVPLRAIDDRSTAALEQLIGSAGSVAGGEHYTHHPGEIDRPAPAAGTPFLVPRWSRELTRTGAARSAGGDSTKETVPVLFPTVMGNLVLLPTDRGFAAFDRETGLPTWHYPSSSVGEPSAKTIWTNQACGRLSTDGRSVFLVEADDAASFSTGMTDSPTHIGAPFAFQQARFFPNFQQAVAQAERVDFVGSNSNGNCLSALDVVPPRQGNRLWSVGGTTGGVEPRLAGHAFLGPPLAAHGRLYAIADYADTVRLVVLDATTGRLDWSLDLGHGDIPLTGDVLRRQIGATPTLAGGVLICPTAAGAVVAIDLADRSLRWGFRYPRSSSPNAMPDDGFGMPRSAPASWRDRTIHIAGDHILLTPPESNFLYCLDFESGEFQWRLPRGEHLFVAAANAERTLLVRRGGTTLLRTADGTPSGTSAVFPAGTAPAGHGYEHANRYVQPLTDGSLVAIELSDGASSLEARSSRGLVLGNLIWHDGLLLSVGADSLHAFDDEQRLAATLRSRLADDPNEATALLRRADRHAAAGRYVEAIADCRSAYDAEPSPTTKNALVAALLDGVRHELPDAAAYDRELRRLAFP